MAAALLVLIMGSVPAVAQDVGVAAAVNQSAQGIRNTVVRTIGLGDNVIYNERIDTNADGLVQLLLADGTTFTVGPNSSLVIDSFVYNPEAGTAQVAATLTKGVLRFIGAATSKTPDGVAITTPVGVVGIRGGVTDINMNPPSGIPPHISMIFGNSVSLRSGGGALLGRLFEAGYSLALTGGSMETIKTPDEWASIIQQALTSGPGQTGGAPNSANNSNVNTVANVNSNTNPLTPPIPMDPIDRPGDLGDAIISDATGNDPLDGPGGDPGDPNNPPTDAFDGYGAGIVVADDPTNPAVTVAYNVISTSLGFSTDLTSIAFDANGDPVSGKLTMVILDNPGTAQAFHLVIDPSGSNATVIDTTHGVLEIPVVADLLADDEVTLPAGVTYCQCDFLRWGFWNARGSFTDGRLTQHFNIENGTWVVAPDHSTTDQLAQLANTTATFNGHAIGTYSDLSAANPVGRTLTAGEMEMNWSFGNRTGTIAIDDFGGRDLNGNLIGDPNLPGFLGNISDGANADGLVKGSFVNDGPTIAAGVMGDFFASDGSWNASGIFVGER